MDPDGHMSNSDFSQMFMQAASAYTNAQWQQQEAGQAVQAMAQILNNYFMSLALAAFGLPDPAQQQNGSGNAAIKPTTFTYNALVPLSPFVQYTVQSDNVHAVFSPETADHLNAAFGELNKDGIVPQITSGFRTDADQTRMQNGGSGSNPAAQFSWHQAGGAVDIGGTHSRQFPTIISVMKSHGFVWGGDFHGRTDPPHFDGRNFLNYQWGRILESQGYWNATQ
jgi:hypothetical protein